MAEVSIIIVSWNGEAYLRDCLGAVLAQIGPGDQVIVVDNASTDASVALVREHYPQVCLIENERNLGFAGGCNVGLRRVETDVAVLLNPDVVVAQDWLRKLISPLLDDETIGIAGCKVYYPGGRRLQHAGGYVTYPQAMPGHYGLNEEDRGQHDTLRDVDYVIGAALAVKRKTLNEIGLLDEGFFLYFEDTDLCMRARRGGYRVVYVPQATLVHVESAVSNKGSDTYLRHMHTSRWRFLLKHYDLGDVLQDTVPAEMAWLARRTTSERRAVTRAYRTTLRDLPAIWMARARDGELHMQQVTQDQNRQIAERLQALREAARRSAELPPVAESGDRAPEERASPPRILDQLQAKWRVQEQPFVSHIPLLGPLIARFREAWNSISTKWYVRLLLQQQNEFNWLVMRCLQEMDRFEEVQSLVSELDEWALDNDRDGTELARQVGELTYTVVRLEKRLAELETRLEQKASSPGRRS